LGLQLNILYVFFTSVSIALFPPLKSIVARGGVVCEFYMEQSSIDFGYVFPLKPNIPLRAQVLIFVHVTANTILPGLLVILLNQLDFRGGGRV
jgi:hypothetical protein